MNEEELNSLQNLAKEHGVKANLRKDAIIPAILAAAISKVAPKEIENTPEISNNDAVDVMMAQTKSKPLK